MKKILAVLLAVCMVFGIMPMTVFAAGDEHIISTTEDWEAFAACVASGENVSDTWKLGADIDVSVNVTTTEYASMTIGTEAHPFEGTFDGQGHTLTVDIHDTYYRDEQTNPGAAPFRFISGAKIKNLTVTGYVVGPGHSAGLVSYNQSGSSLIENCMVYTDVEQDTGANQRIGGVLGHNMTSTVTMKNVAYGGTLINSIYTHNIAGGFVGWTDRSTINLENCVFSGECTGNVEAFSPLILQNPSIDSILHDGVNASFDRVYYTLEGSDKFAEKTVGYYFIDDSACRFVFKGLPDNGIYEYITGPDGMDYHIPCTVEGVQPNYKENSNFNFTVKSFNGEVLSQQYYTAELKKDGNIVPVIGSEGDYTFTIKGKNGYSGTFKQDIKVYDGVPYISEDGSEKSVSLYYPVTPDLDHWSYNSLTNRGWYVVFGDVTIKNRIEVNGDINLILCDGATLNAEQGIGVNNSSSLTIRVQSARDGVINATGQNTVSDEPGIGGGGNITINGGIINAESKRGAAIGGGNAGKITINDGDVTARSNGGGPGIGDCESVTINDGTVTAYGNFGSAGIGGGWASGAGNITINDGIINAYGGDESGTGIGGGRAGSGGSITINGGFIRAYGGEPEDIPNARRIDIGTDKNDAAITLNYTDESADTMSVTANVYAGKIALKKSFYDRETLTRFASTKNLDNSAIGGKTIIPAARVCTISFRSGLGSGAMPKVLKIKGDEYTLPKNTFTSPSELRPFTAWIVDTVDDEPVLMQPGDKITLTDNVRITAKYLSEYAALQTMIDNAENGATITLDQDYISDRDEDTAFIIPEGKNLTIDLAGYTIDRNLAAGEAKSDGNVFIVNGTLTIKDTSSEGTGKVSGGNSTDAGGAFRVLSGGVLNIEGGTISGNRSTNGGAIYNIGTVNISGGSIKDNTAQNSGGGIFNNDAGTLNLTGGNITNNSAAENYHGGGIHTSGTINVSGNPVVKDNTRGGEENNIGLFEDDVINVTGALSDSAYIGVNKSRGNSSESELGVITSGLDGNGTAWVFKGDGEEQHVLPYEGEASVYPSDTYYITIAPYEHGTVTVDSLYAKQGARIGFKSTADKGCRERSFKVTDEEGRDVNVSFGTEKNWVYMPDSNITVKVVFEPYYSISVDKNTPYGTINLEWVWAYKGQKVPLSATPNKNCRFVEWLVKDADGNSVDTSGGLIMPESSITVSAVFEPVDNPEGPVSYVDADGNDMTPVTAYTKIGPNTRIDTTGWYVVKDNVGVGRQIISGDVNLILCDDVTLTVNKGIFILDGGSLTIWTQKGGTGGFRVENITIDSSPAIDGPGNVTLTVNGGTIYAEGNKAGDRFDDPAGGPGIFVKNLVINAGSVTAVGSRYAAGIGGGYQQGGANVTINGGYVKATGGSHGAGIGGGDGGHGGTITINGGTVDAVSSNGSAGIGGGYGGSGGNITINGGNVLAAGYNNGAGIGGGYLGSGGNIAINGGNVRASSNYNTGHQPSYGIGAGSGSSEANITLSWTNETDSIYTNSYGGTIRLLKQFVDENENYYGAETEFKDGKSELYGTDINGKTLLPLTTEIPNEGGNDQGKDISKWTVKGLKSTTYTGKAIKPKVEVVSGNGEKATVKVQYKNNKNVGTAKVIITGTGDYSGKITKAFKITKAKNPITVKAVTKTVKLSKIKAAKQTVKPIKVTEAQGNVTYKLTSIPKTLGKLVKINSKGVITISKWGKAKKGAYKFKVKITAKGNKNYKNRTIVKLVKVKIK